jgi:uncharacterized protein (TIGR02594 family)
MPEIDQDSFMRDWRAARLADGKKIAQAEYDLIMSAIGGTYQPGAAPPIPVISSEVEPAWLREARALMGTKEIPGPQHNSWIVKQWAQLGAAWFNDDETPWCGLFVAHCMQVAGQPFPGKGQFARALAWKDWGKPCGSILGSVAVFGRQGGGHVGFLVGESADRLYVLGGNQSNAVNIMPIAKTRLVGLRWPSALALGTAKPARMSGGAISVNER